MAVKSAFLIQCLDFFVVCRVCHYFSSPEKMDYFFNMIPLSFIKREKPQNLFYSKNGKILSSGNYHLFSIKFYVFNSTSGFFGWFVMFSVTACFPLPLSITVIPVFVFFGWFMAWFVTFFWWPVFWMFLAGTSVSTS